MGFGEGGFEGGMLENESIREDIDSMWAWLTEKGSEDATKAAAVRQTLYQCLNKLGVVNQSGYIDLNAWSDFVSSQAQRKTNPIAPPDYPVYELFLEKFEEYKETHPQLEEIKRHTADLPKYLYGLGMVISDKLVYESIFENDNIQVRNGEITNGKHREAAIDILRSCGFVKNTPWVKFEYEQK